LKISKTVTVRTKYPRGSHAISALNCVPEWSPQTAGRPTTTVVHCNCDKFLLQKSSYLNQTESKLRLWLTFGYLSFFWFSVGCHLLRVFTF